MSNTMSGKLNRDYPHILFRKHWVLNEHISSLLGQCEAYVNAMSKMPIMPDHYKKLLNVSLVKGAQATTAIEGNTLTEEEIENIQQGINMPPSKEYQQIEVQNILIALNTLLKEVIYDNKSEKITPKLIARFHKMVGQNLGEHFDAIPGKWRNDNRIVGKYRCPDYRDVQTLIHQYCDWLFKEFNYKSGQSFKDAVIQAIVSHIYLEWIHPFGDGNGRTGRLLEFYILLRGGVPDIASHLLSNHYNKTRSDYYLNIEKSTSKKDLSEFIAYALLGFRDGLVETLEVVEKSLIEMAWKKLIYDKFATIKYKNKRVFARRRELILNFPPDEHLDLEEVTLINPKVAKMYGGLSERTVQRDLDVIQELGLVIRQKSLYLASTWLVMKHIARKRPDQIPF